MPGHPVRRAARTLPPALPQRHQGRGDDSPAFAPVRRRHRGAATAGAVRLPEHPAAAHGLDRRAGGLAGRRHARHHPAGRTPPLPHPVFLPHQPLCRPEWGQRRGRPVLRRQNMVLLPPDPPTGNQPGPALWHGPGLRLGLHRSGHALADGISARHPLPGLRPCDRSRSQSHGIRPDGGDGRGGPGRLLDQPGHLPRPIALPRQGLQARGGKDSRTLGGCGRVPVPGGGAACWPFCPSQPSW